MFEYIRRVNYYETDKMGIVHHSNYIRFMEEARVAFLDSLGCGHEKLENEGLLSPVVSVSGKYKKPLKFPDVMAVGVYIKAYNGVGLKFGYEIRNKLNGEVVFTGESEHCFTSLELGVVRLKNILPNFHGILMSAYEADKQA